MVLFARTSYLVAVFASSVIPSCRKVAAASLERNTVVTKCNPFDPIDTSFVTDTSSIAVTSVAFVVAVET